MLVRSLFGGSQFDMYHKSLLWLGFILMMQFTNICELTFPKCYQCDCKNNDHRSPHKILIKDSQKSIKQKFKMNSYVVHVTSDSELQHENLEHVYELENKKKGIRSLPHSSTEHQQQLIQLQARLNESQQLQDVFQKQLKSDDTENRKLHEDMSHLTRHSHALLQAKVKLARELKQVHAENKLLNNDINTVKQEVNGLLDIKATLENQLESSTEEQCWAKDELAALKKQTTDTEQRYEKELELIKAGVEAKSDEINNLKTKCINLEAMRVNLEYELKSHQADNIALKNENAFYSQRNEISEKSIADLFELVKSERDNNVANKLKQSELNINLSKAEEIFTNMENSLKKEKTEKEVLFNELYLMRQDQVKSEETMAGFCMEIKGLNSEIAQLKNINADLSQILANQKNLIKKEQDYSKTLSNELDEAKQELIDMKSQQVGLVTQLKKAQSACSFYKSDVDTCLKNNNILQDILKSQFQYKPIENKESQSFNQNDTDNTISAFEQSQFTGISYNATDSDEIAKSKQEIKELKQQIKGLLAIKTTLEDNVTSVQAANVKMKAAVNQLEAQIRSLNIVNDKLICDLITKNSALNTQLGECDKMKEFFRGEHEIRMGLENQLKDEQSEQKITKTELSKLMNQLENMRNIKAGLEIKLKMEKSEVISCKEMANQLNSQLIWISDQLKKSHKVSVELNTEVHQLRASIDELKQTQITLENQLQKEQDLNKSKTCEYSVLQKEISDMQEATGALEMQLRSEQVEKMTMKADLHWLTEEAIALHTKKISYENELKGDNEAIHKLNEELFEIKSINTGLEIKVKNLLNENNVLKEEVSSLKFVVK